MSHIEINRQKTRNNMYTTVQKSGAGKFFCFFFMFLKEVSSAHQGCNYLIKNTVKIVK